MRYLETDTKSSPGRKRAAGAKRKTIPAIAEASAAAVAFAVDAEASVADLEEHRPTGVGPLERALAARVRSAVAQLRASAEQVGRDGLMVAGSMGQERAHPLLKPIADLRREIADSLKELTFRVEQQEIIERMNELMRERRMTTEDAAALAAELLGSPASPN